MTIPVLFEDESLLVVDKPAGITVNRSETTQDAETIQDWTQERLQIIKATASVPPGDYTSDAYFAQAFVDRGGIVHRLDKETSGILLVAKNPHAFKNLQQQFKDRTVHKTYQALVHGILLPQDGEISIPVDRLPWNRKQFGVVPGGRPSITVYKTLRIYQTKDKHAEKLSLVELYPKTGRTHQIRVHMKYLNRPIFSDFLYAGRKTARDDRKLLDRVFLHAAGISLQHPKSREKISFQSQLPKELQTFMIEHLV